MTVEPLILVNFLVCLLCVWLSMAINSRFLRPAILNKKRFALYELRDRLTLLVMRGEIDEKSEEYLTLLRLLNNALNSTKDFRITRFIKMQSEIISDLELRAHINSILSKIENDKMPDEYKSIVSEFFEVAHHLFEHKIWILKNLVLRPLRVLINIVSLVTKTARKSKGYLDYQQERLSDIGDELEGNANKFAL